MPEHRPPYGGAEDRALLLADREELRAYAVASRAHLDALEADMAERRAARAVETASPDALYALQTVPPVDVAPVLVGVGGGDA